MEMISYIAAGITLSAFLPQTVRTIRLKETRDLSLITFFMLSTAGVLWTVYGFSTDQMALWVTNGIVTACTAVIVALKLRYG